jgi:hypothetical protein
MINKPFCTAPWSGITIRENGDVKVCCVGKTVLGNINSQSMDDIFNNDVHNKIKQNLLVGIPDENCNLCTDQLKHSGTATLRNHYNLHYPETVDQLKFVDIRWNNLCNLSCIYCNPQFSTTWAEKLNPSSIKIVKHDYDLELENWILSRSDQIHELMLVGGEPLLMKQNYALINKLSDDARLSIITNLSYNLANNPCVETLFNRPADNTLWNISVENYGEQFEYIRNGATWKQFDENLLLLTKNNPDTVSLLMVYGIFSGLQLLDTVKYYYTMYGIKKIQLQMLNNHISLNLFNYPINILKIARDQLVEILEWQKQTYSIDYDLYKCADIESIISSLNKLILASPTNILSKNQFLTDIEKYDNWNTRKFSELWSKQYNLIMESLI